MSARYRSRSGGSSYKAMLSARRSRVYAKSAAARTTLTSAQRGYMRTGGYYGRYRGRRATQAEMKFLDTTLTTTAAAAGSLSGSLNIVAQGDTESQRNGRKITIKQISIRATLLMNNSTAVTDTSEEVRFLLVQDKQANGAAATVLDVLETASVRAFNNLANKSRFNILVDKRFSLNQMGATPTGAAYTFGELTQNFALYKKCNIPIEYDNSATTGAITTIRSNNLFFILLGETGALATMSSTTRIRYTDN